MYMALLADRPAGQVILTYGDDKEWQHHSHSAHRFAFHGSMLQGQRLDINSCREPRKEVSLKRYSKMPNLLENDPSLKLFL